MSSTVLQDALSVLDAVVVESPLKSRSFEVTRQLLTQEQVSGQYVLYRLLLEQGITKDLIAAGIPPEPIILAFLLEEQTAATA